MEAGGGKDVGVGILFNVCAAVKLVSSDSEENLILFYFWNGKYTKTTSYPPLCLGFQAQDAIVRSGDLVPLTIQEKEKKKCLQKLQYDKF
jgi:hypothetical protein